ncbi:hypothetical protein FFLO_06816 [Filobasidium floriforme]|uniref:Uncharacterized protein n=1 Tax=Filobasidium floriforme TaxID=5210 RepID=A0A8K0JEN6_9TREE|nr:uncharacterized protein HD553DRAFT_339898 [Filobasidium floriforme]KAG7527564.1 hypothetical protein FFLO_06816 [Filobasidium floriforme]KAH8088542.1 hypothetical protein HD553DRAFT_339898 [Filobasidium floriforme]
MTSTRKHPLKGSVGHIVHHKQMRAGWTTSTPTSLAEFRPNQVNIVLELWTVNIMESDYQDRHISEFLDFVKKHWKTTPKTTESNAIKGKRKHPSPTKVPRKKKVIVIDDSDGD